jgi:hypothetical protein
MGILTEIINKPTGRRYRLSTVEVGSAELKVWQTAVFRKGLLGLLGLYRQPALFLGGVETENWARIQHQRVEALARDSHPNDWEDLKFKLASELINEEAASALTT